MPAAMMRTMPAKVVQRGISAKNGNSPSGPQIVSVYSHTVTRKVENRCQAQAKMTLRLHRADTHVAFVCKQSHSATGRSRLSRFE
jgi:hypothetical protein